MPVKSTQKIAKDRWGDDTVYEYSDDATIQLFDNTYYIMTPSDLTSVENLKEDSVHVVTDYYEYYYDGTDYIHNPSSEPDTIDISASGVATVAAIANQVYTGSAVKPAVTVKAGSTTLKNNTDYTVSYSNNTNVGTAKVVITGKGNYTGKIEKTFKITAKPISKATSFKLAKTSYVYTGSAFKPAVTVADGGRTLKNGTDYTVAYKNNVNAGTATVTVTGKGNYSGTKNLTFKITAKKVTPTVKLSAASYTYTGKAITPAVTVKAGSKTLKKGTDYTVSYATGRKNVGTYKVTVKMKGNYSGSRTVSFKINPKGTSLKSLTKASKALTVKWAKQAAKMAASVITGYQVQLSTNAKFSSGLKTVNVTGVNNVSKKITGLKGATKYFARIRTYKKVGSVTYYSGWSAAKNAVTAK